MNESQPSPFIISVNQIIRMMGQDVHEPEAFSNKAQIIILHIKTGLSCIIVFSGSRHTKFC
jgi:hypothetical protein